VKIFLRLDFLNVIIQCRLNVLKNKIIFTDVNINVKNNYNVDTFVKSYVMKIVNPVKKLAKNNEFVSIQVYVLTFVMSNALPAQL
jgi:hypothetical protein